VGVSHIKGRTQTESEISGSHGGEYEDGCLWIVATCDLVEIK
jgi:hypothetical protein